MWFTLSNSFATSISITHFASSTFDRMCFQAWWIPLPATPPNWLSANAPLSFSHTFVQKLYHDDKILHSIAGTVRYLVVPSAFGIGVCVIFGVDHPPCIIRSSEFHILRCSDTGLFSKPGSESRIIDTLITRDFFVIVLKSSLK